MDLPWADLEGNLSPSTVLVETNVSIYNAECTPEILKSLEGKKASQYNLIDQPHGLCLPFLYGGFQSMNPVANEENKTMAERWALYGSSEVGGAPLWDPSFPDNLKSWLDPSNPSWDLPQKVLFPQNAGDVSAAVTFAKDHNMELSVKNSGHSFQGASSKRDTLLLNMNKFQRYSSDGPNVCSMAQGAGFEDLLTNQPCLLALARGKSATLKVGGGENFDKVYRALKEWNELQEDGYKYHIVGGAAGTVSPMGWTWQGGLAGTLAGRMFGFGVDQGEHPTHSITEEDNFLAPATTQSIPFAQSPSDRDDFNNRRACQVRTHRVGV